MVRQIRLGLLAALPLALSGCGMAISGAGVFASEGGGSALAASIRNMPAAAHTSIGAEAKFQWYDLEEEVEGSTMGANLIYSPVWPLYVFGGGGFGWADLGSLLEIGGGAELRFGDLALFGEGGVAELSFSDRDPAGRRSLSYPFARVGISLLVE